MSRDGGFSFSFFENAHDREKSQKYCSKKRSGSKGTAQINQDSVAQLQPNVRTDSIHDVGDDPLYQSYKELSLEQHVFNPTIRTMSQILVDSNKKKNQNLKVNYGGSRRETPKSSFNTDSSKPGDDILWFKDIGREVQPGEAKVA